MIFSPPSLLLAFAWPSLPAESSENIGVSCSTARLRSTSPIRNVLEAPELGMLRFKGQMFGSKWCLFHCSRTKVHGLLCNDYAVCGKPMYYYLQCLHSLSADCTPHYQHYVHIDSLWEVVYTSSPKKEDGPGFSHLLHVLNYL